MESMASEKLLPKAQARSSRLNPNSSSMRASLQLHAGPPDGGFWHWELMDYEDMWNFTSSSTDLNHYRVGDTIC